MILKIDRDFLNKLETLYNLASPDSTATVEVAKGKMKVAFHQKEIQVLDVFLVETDETFSFSMGMQMFYKLLLGFEGCTVSASEMGLRLDDNQTRLDMVVDTETIPIIFPTAGKQKLQELPPDVFPMAEYVAYAAAPSKGNSATERICLLLQKGLASICAMDGYRAARVRIPISYDGDTIECRLQQKLVAAIARLAKAGAPPKISIAASGGHFLLRVGSIRVVARDIIVAGESPWNLANSAMNGSLDNTSLQMTVIREQMAQYLRRTTLIMDGLARTRSPVNMSINRKAGTVKLKYTTGLGVFTDEFDAEYAGDVQQEDDAVKISFSPIYLMDMCSKIKGSVLGLHIVNGLTPVCVVESVGSAEICHLVLPVRPKDAEEAEDEVVAELRSKKGQQQEPVSGAVSALQPAGKQPDPYEMFE